MLIPLGTERPLRRPTLVTIILVAVNVIIFVTIKVLATLSPQFNESWNTEWMTKLAVHGRNFHWWTLITSVFLHGSWLHLLGNMVFLWVFGQNVEDRFGRAWFLLFYLLGGVAASALHATFDDNPAIGASGAISAVTGAFLVLFPRTHVKCLVFFFFIGIYAIPSWAFILFALVRDFVFTGTNDGVAHLAHLGGYAFGILVSLFLLWRRILTREPYDLFTIGRQAYRRRQFKELGVKRDESFSKRLASNGVAAAPHNSEVSQARARVGDHVSRHNLSAAADEYKALVERFGHVSGATTLSRQSQMDLANHFFAASDHQSAAYAYERFLDMYSKDVDAPRARLMLGLINARYLNDPVRAKAVLAGLPSELRDQSQRDLAQRLIDELG
jgi:membrane associated rhomboid family serine protease